LSNEFFGERYILYVGLWVKLGWDCSSIFELPCHFWWGQVTQNQGRPSTKYENFDAHAWPEYADE
jgi:hypothetical protein